MYAPFLYAYPYYMVVLKSLRRGMELRFSVRGLCRALFILERKKKMEDTPLIQSKADKKAKTLLFKIPIVLIGIAIYTIIILLLTEVEGYKYVYEQGTPRKQYDVVNGVIGAFRGNTICLVFFIIACTFIVLGLFALILYWVHNKHHTLFILERKKEKMTSKNYQNMYEIYKKFPLINAISIMILTLVWSIVDYNECITGISDLGFGCFVIWLLIGAVVAGIVAFITMVSISATIVRTDAILQIEENVKKSN